MQGFVISFYDVHRPVDGCSDVLLPGLGLDVGPAGLHGDPEHVPFGVLVGLLGVIPFIGLRLQLLVEFFEGVGDVLQEHQGQDDVLVFGSINVAPEGVGRPPELGTQICRGGFVIC